LNSTKVKAPLKTLNKIRKSKDGKALLGNFISLSILQFIGYFSPLITFPYLARVIGVDGFGKLAFASSVVVYFDTFADFGFNYTAVRDIAKKRDDIQEVSRIFSIVMTAKFLLFLFSILIFAILIYSVPAFYENRLLFWISFMSIPGRILFPDWLFQAFEKMKYITIMNLVSKLLFISLIFVVIKKEDDYIYQPLLILSGNLVSGIISIYFIRKMFKIKYTFPAIGDVFKSIKEGKDMFISLFLPNLYTNFSVTLLGFYGGSFVTGIYSSGKKFIDMAEQVLGVLSRTFFPFLSRRIDKHDTYVKIGASISVFFGIVLFFGADLLVKIFYTDQFSDSSNIIRIMSVAPFFLFLMNTYGTNYLVIMKKEKILRNIIIYCSIGGFALAWFAVINFSYIGVAITITTVWGVRGFLTWYYAMKIKNTQ
jgi:O-antigen/teichoic acid export membrane protein